MRVSMSDEQAEVVIAALTRYSSYVPLNTTAYRQQEIARGFRDRLVKLVENGNTQCEGET